MVALLGFFEQGQVFVQHFLLGEGYAIYAHQLLTLFITTPVGSGERHYLDSLDGGGVGDMRTAAEIGKGTLCVGGYVTVLKLADKLAFVCFATFAKHLQRVVL